MNHKRVMFVIIPLIVIIGLFWECEQTSTIEPTETIPQDLTNTSDQIPSFLQKTISGDGYASGTDHGFFWSLYVEGGTATISFDGADQYAGNFEISYSNVNDVVGGKGWSTGSSSRVIGYNVGYLSGSYNFVGVYGWTTNPLIEYYIAEFGSASGGTYCGTVTSDGHTYSVYKQQRVNAPSIQGTQTFWQYKSSWGGQSTGNNGTVTMSNHWNAWRNMCGSLGTPNYQIFALEAWGGKSGYIDATVWEAGSSGGSSGGGNNYTELPFRLRARSTDGQAKVKLTINGKTIGDWTIGTSWGDYRCSAWSSRGNIRVEFYNDNGTGRDVQIDYLSVNVDYRQAEDQYTNTAVWQNGSCGGHYSEWMHCNGYIDFGNTP